MTHELNDQVLALVREQQAFLSQAPQFAASFEADINAELEQLYAAAKAADNQTLMTSITTVHERVQEMKALLDTQGSGAANVGIVITALKVQRDELAAELKNLLKQLGYQEGEDTPLNAFIEQLYKNWLETVDTNEVESDAQDELLDLIYADIEANWGLAEGSGRIVMAALRGHTDLDEMQRDQMYNFLTTLEWNGGDS